MMRKPCLFTFLFALLVNIAVSQVRDSFSDGDFAKDPEWQGTLHLFCVTDKYVLQLCAESGGEAYLFTENQMLNKTEWNFRVHLSFSPSTNNYLIVWLSADTLAPEHISSGYYLKFGEAGSNDAIELYYYADSTHTKILRGIEGNISSSFHKDIKVENDDGNWTLFSKNIEYDYFIKECDGYSNYDCITKYFGLHCTFSSSNATKFSFDDFLVCELQQDLSLPEISNIIYKNENSLLVEYSKAVANGDNKYNYYLDKQLLYPEQVTSVGTGGKLFLLEFETSGVTDFLCINNIYDYGGNWVNDTCISVSMHSPKYRDIVINEVMFDISPPPNSLPSHRYIELFNTTDKLYDISSWRLTSIDKTFDFPSDVQIIDKYLLVTVNKSDYDIYDNVVNFTSFTIKNTDVITLFDCENNLIDEISYSPQMFFSDEKFGGGWSLEQINPYAKISGSTNWHECVDDAGGTPLKINSANMLDVVWGEKPTENDLLINEVMPNSLDGLSDYIEIINVSDKIISLRDVDFCVFSNDSYKTYPIGLANILIYPDEIKLISSNIDGLAETYPYHDIDNFVVSKNFPNLKNDESCVGLFNSNGEILDKLCYSSNMHFIFLKETKGVSLERVSHTKSSADKDNWHSAAETYNYGSPGTTNSQSRTARIEEASSTIEINPKVFSPNNDGIDDVVEICFNFEGSDILVNSCVFNKEGFPIKYLLKNEYVSPSYCVFWDGIGDRGTPVPAGSYILVVDIHNTSGKTERFRTVLSVRY